MPKSATTYSTATWVNSDDKLRIIFWKIAVVRKGFFLVFVAKKKQTKQLGCWWILLNIMLRAVPISLYSELFTLKKNTSIVQINSPMLFNKVVFVTISRCCSNKSWGVGNILIIFNLFLCLFAQQKATCEKSKKCLKELIKLHLVFTNNTH